MRCKKEEFIENEFFHFYNHAVDNLDLFKEHDDYIYFLKKFKNNRNKYPLSVIAYCLMPNHFHFLLRQDSKIPIYNIFRDCFTSYALHYNSKYNRKGTLFMGPLQHIRVKTEKYLLCLCKYIHFNPKKAKLVKDLTDWKYSNYLEWIEKRNGDLFYNEIKQLFYYDIIDYEENILEYEQYINEREFNELAIDYDKNN